MEEKLYDKNRREIKIGDVLKVYHFTGARRKKYYMYKQAIEIKEFGKTPTKYLAISHLDLSGKNYHEILDGRVLNDYEIVQGFGGEGICFEDRPKKSPHLILTDI